MRTIKLYGTGSATANAVAQVTIPSRSRLVGVQACIRLDQVADNSSVVLELSKASATEVAVNGSQQCVAMWGNYANLVTSGIGMGGINVFYPVDVSLDQGQILYLHAAVTTSTFYAEIVLHLM